MKDVIYWAIKLEIDDWIRLSRRLLLLFSRLPEYEEIRYKWHSNGNGYFAVEIHRPTSPNCWTVHRYRCSAKSALRLIALARRYPYRFQGYL